jgi:hypothetical protein
LAAEIASLVMLVAVGSLAKVQVSVALPLVIVPWVQAPDYWIEVPLSAPA